MKRILFAVVLALFVVQARAADCTWSSASTSASRSVIGVGALDCTFSAASQGLNLTGVGAIAVKVCAASGQTIATVFTLYAWTYDPWLAVWMRAPSYDLAGSTTGSRCEDLGGFKVWGPVGRIGYSPHAGTVSSGSIYVRIIANMPDGELR
jgi:hypothetical protein